MIIDLLRVITVGYNLPKCLKQGCIKWTFFSEIHDKPQESWKLVLQYASSSSGNSSSSLGYEHTCKFLRHTFRNCGLLMTMFWKYRLQQILGQTYVKAYQILEIMICKRRKTSMLNYHCVMNCIGPKTNKVQVVAEEKSFPSWHFMCIRIRILLWCIIHYVNTAEESILDLLFLIKY